jgi:hypothetical protein
MAVWKGTAINPTSIYEKIYFNKNLSVEQVRELYNSVRDTNNNNYYIFAMDSACLMFGYVNGILTLYMQTNTGKGPTYFDEDNGWQYPNETLILDNKQGLAKYNGIDVGLENEKLASFVSGTEFIRIKAVKQKIVLHPIEDGWQNEGVDLYPRTSIDNIVTEDGTPLSEAELELSDAEPSANAKELKKVLMNGTEWKVSGSGGGEVLELEVADLTQPVSLDDATIEKLTNKVITTIRIITKVEESGVEVDAKLDFVFNCHITMDTTNVLVYITAVPLLGFDLYNLMVSPTDKVLMINPTPYRLLDACDVESNYYRVSESQTSSNTLGYAEFAEGRLIIKLNFDGENLENDRYIPSTKAVKNYVDNAIGTALTTILEGES